VKSGHGANSSVVDHSGRLMVAKNMMMSYWEKKDLSKEIYPSVGSGRV
jgi:hypothetical protein